MEVVPAFDRQGEYSDPPELVPDLHIRASPAARARARELGVDLHALAAATDDGRVTVEQIEAWAGGDTDVSSLAELAERPEVSEARARATLPHPTLRQIIDVTILEAGRRRYCDDHETDAQLPLTAFAVKACAMALREHPRMNSSLIRHGRALAIKRYFHIGVAVETERGLVVPVLTNADQRPLRELARELDELTTAARSHSFDHERHDGATFTVADLRGFGAQQRTPQVHPPQVGSLGLCRARTEAGRTLLPISLAYDAQVNDEASARRFLATIAELLREPLAMLLRA